MQKILYISLEIKYLKIPELSLLNLLPKSESIIPLFCILDTQGALFSVTLDLFFVNVILP